MWDRRNRAEVTCIACGETLARVDAREYDKHGNRWDRRHKEFEYLCKPCYRDMCHQPRDGLEALLVGLEVESTDQRRFVERYYEATESSSGTGEDSDREQKR